jgi:XTP/dITP diphosphohydrolase
VNGGANRGDSPPVPLYVATSNMGKLREMYALFAGTPFALQLFSGYVSPPEGIERYSDNAALKARALHAQLRARGTPAAVLADDSGLEVSALGGRPGVATADYGGSGADWPARRGMLLAELAAAHTLDRRARFVCAMHLIDPAGREFASLGTVDGTIALEERGELGFSFDPVFCYPPAGMTFAELDEVQKNRVSHRAIAAAAIVAAAAAASRSFEPACTMRGEIAVERE